MTVIHLEPVSNYEKCLAGGGQHTFEITVDEMPSLQESVPPGQAVVIAFEEIAAEVPDGTWYRIARTVSERGGTAIYSRTSPESYRVACILPKPQLDQDENP